MKSKRKRISRSFSAVTSSSEGFDVFLNFRGADTRYGFVDCLYEFLIEAGIRVFMDDEALRVGNDIGSELLAAIDSSRIYIPVFSRTYASSKWCLIELARMVGNHSMGRESDCKEILPVFFDVEPEDLKLKTDLYAKDLRRHVESFGECVVRKWQKAMRKVSKMKGWNLQSNHGQGKLIKRIVERVSRLLEIRHRILPIHFVGMEEQVEDIMHILDCGYRDVRIVVVHGMGGIGKSTLAGAVFNKVCLQFQGCSFLSNVRESAAGNCILNLQDKLLQDLLRFSPSNSLDENDAMTRIRTSLRNRVVLIILDDVSEMGQIRKLVGMGEWLGLGSRVIITTRNLSCVANLDEIENDDEILHRKRIYIHRMRELSFDDSLQLFCQHAFGKTAPPLDYDPPSRDILSFTRGVPLAIEVMGSYLKGKRLAYCKEVLKKLRKVPDERLYQTILMSSYEALCDEEKEIFSDIAFFFAGQDKTTAFYYWEACGLFPELSFDTLISYALVKIDRYNRLWMHDLLKVLGREDDHRKQCTRNLGRRSRLCDEDAKRSLLRKEGMECVNALRLDSTHAYTFTPAELSRLLDLKLLDLHGGNFTGEFRHGHLSELRWFSWRDCPREFHGTNLHFDNLVVLRILESNITDTWAGWEQFRTARSLKSLELERLDLTATPDLSSFLNLERLVVRECPSLVRIHPSIGRLRFMTSLELVNDRYLRRDLPQLPNSICDLKVMSRLVITGFDLKQLPENIGDLKGLRILAITWCGLLRYLPDSIGDLESLCELCLSHDGFTQLPGSIGKLRNLTKLVVRFNGLMGLPATIGDLVRLEVLDASGNECLRGEIPGEFDKLQSLRTLNLSGTGIRRLPARIVKLPLLESLSLEFCNETQELPDLPSSLTKLEVSSRSLKVVPDLSSLTNLVNLSLSNRGYRCDDDGLDPQVMTGNTVSWIRHLRKLEDLTMDLWPMTPPCLPTGLDQLSRLRRLELSCQVPSALSFPSGLESLSLYHCKSLSLLGSHSNLGGLSTLTLFESSATEIRASDLESLKNLTYLSIRGCKFLERVQDISTLQKLKHLEFSECPKLVEIGGLMQLLLGPLQHLGIMMCDSIPCLPNPSDVELPRKLHLGVFRCSKLRDHYGGPYKGYFQA